VKETTRKTYLFWEDNIKKDFQEVGWGMEWSNLAEDRDKLQSFVIP